MPIEVQILSLKGSFECRVYPFLTYSETQRPPVGRSVGTIGEMVLRAGGEADPREGMAYAQKMIDKYVHMKYRK